MKTILLTGPIGSGKSQAAACLRLQGYPVFDCDSEAKKLYDEIPGLKDRIEKELGIPFASIGQVFQNKSMLEKLESILYPILIQKINCWKDTHNQDIVFIESAVMTQKEIFDEIYDEIWFVDADPDVRKSRNPKAAERDAFQSFDRRKSLVSRMIVNNSSIDNLNIQLKI